MADDTNPQTYNPVTDGDADVAETMDGDRMKIQAVGRRPMQRVYLWEGNKEAGSKGRDKGSGFTNKVYKPAEDGPEVISAGDFLPTSEELEPGPSAVQYLEVGLVIGDEPARYKPKSTGNKSKKEIKAERQRRGDLPRDKSAIRAFIPITETIPQQSRYYVGTRKMGGRLNPRCIDGDTIFYYPEFWQGIPSSHGKGERRNFVNQATKTHAAVSKTQAERATAPITMDDIEKWTTSNPLAVRAPENVANSLTLQYTLYQATGDRGDLRNLLSHMSNAAPDLRYTQHTASDGVYAFFDFGEDLSVESAEELMRELKIAAPGMPTLAVELIQTVHRVLREDDRGKRLPYRELPFFLGICDKNIRSLDIGEKVVKQEVERALDTVSVHDTYNTGRTSSSVESMTDKNHHLVLECAKDFIDQVIKFLQESNQQVAEQHGATLKQAGILELMHKVGNTVDVVHLQNLFEQLAGLHAVQHAAANGKAGDQLSQLSDLLGKALSVSK